MTVTIRIPKLSPMLYLMNTTSPIYQNVLHGQCDPEELVAVIDGAHMRHRILPGGQLNAHVEHVQLQAGLVQRGRYGMAVHAEGAWPPDVIVVGMVLGATEAISVNGVSCASQSIQIYARENELSYRAPAGTTWVAYGVDRLHLASITERLYGRPLPIPETGMVSYQPTPRGACKIAVALEALFTCAQLDSHRGPCDPLILQLEEQLMVTMTHAICHPGQHGVDSRSSRAARRRRLGRDAEEFLRANAMESFSLDALASASGASGRMLEYHFHEMYGVSPLAWFRSMKLNEVHRILRTTDPGNRRISDIAADWGFTHLGRFAAAYRQLFGEAPSQTLARISPT